MGLTSHVEWRIIVYTKETHMGHFNKFKGVLFTLLILLVTSTYNFALENAIKIKIEGNGYSDEIAVRFLEGTTEGFDNMYDAHKLFSNNMNVPSIYTKTNANEELSINSLPISLVTDKDVVIFTRTEISNTYTLTPEIIGEFVEESSIYLEDIQTGVLTNFAITSSYSFDALGGGADMQGRFILHFGKDFKLTKKNVSCNGKKSGAINLEASSNSDWSVSLTNSLNQAIYSNRNLSGVVTIKGLEADTYYLSAISDDGDFNDTITINQPEAITATLTKKDISCYEETDGRLFLSEVNGGVGAYHILWSNADTAFILENLTADIYNVTITDANNCVVELSETIIEPDQVVADFNIAQSKMEVNENLTFHNNSSNASTYNWDFGDNHHSNEENPQYQYENEGVYKVILTATQHGCTSTAAKTITVEESELISNNLKEKFIENLINFYPNPAKDYLTFNNPNNVFKTATLYNPAGQLVDQIDLKANSQFDLSKISVSGLYNIILTTKHDGIIARAIMINK